MRILLINPPFNRLKGAKTTYFPLGLGYIAAILRKNGFEVGIYNAENCRENLSEISNVMLLKQHYKYIQSLNDESHYVWQEIRNTLLMFKPDMVGVSVMTNLYGTAIKVSVLSKEFNPNIKIVWGGPHPTIQSNEVLQNDFVNFVIRGEGELTLVELCHALVNGANTFSQIKGLSYKKNGEIVHNQPRELISNLDELPPPAKDLSLYPKLYSPAHMGDMITSRGCPFKCAFCSAQNIWGRKVRFISVEKTINEIRDVCEKYNTKDFFFWDDTFTVDRQRTLELCQKLIDERLNISWGCTTRVDAVDNELLKMMKRAGCNIIDFGIESGSERMLKLIKKNITLEQITKAVRLARRHKIDLRFFFMIGFPEETKEDIKQTKDLIRALNSRIIIFSIFTPHPGSELYNQVVESGLLPRNPDWSQFSHQSLENHFTKYINKDEFRQIVIDIANLIDRYNLGLLNACRSVWRYRSYYLKNPYVFLKKVISFLRRKLSAKGSHQNL